MTTYQECGISRSMEVIWDKTILECIYKENTEQSYLNADLHWF